MEEFEYKGHWWIPVDESGEEKSIPGILRFNSEDTLELELNGSLSGRLTEPFAELPSYQMVWGRLNNGKVVTLVDCISSGRSGDVFGKSKYITEKIRCSFAFIGNAWLTSHDEGFSKIYFFRSHALKLNVVPSNVATRIVALSSIKELHRPGVLEPVKSIWYEQPLASPRSIVTGL